MTNKDLSDRKPLQTDPSNNLRESAQDEPFRFVFLSDIHLRDRYRSDEGMKACLRAVEQIDPRPTFLLTGGDQCDGLRDLDIESAAGLAAR